MPDLLVSVEGKVVTDSDQAVEDLLNKLHEGFPLTKSTAKTAADVLAV